MAWDETGERARGCHVVKVGFAERLDVGYVREKGVKEDSESLGLSNCE